MQTLLGNVMGAVSANPQDWLRDPFGMFGKTREYFFDTLSKFAKRRRNLRVLEDQNTALGRFAVSLPPGAARDKMSQGYADNLNRLERLRSEARDIAEKTHLALMALQKIRTLLLRLPGGQHLDPLGDVGQVPAFNVVAAGLMITVIGATTVALAWIAYADHTASGIDNDLKFFQGLNIPDEKKAQYYAEARRHGGNPAPGAWWKSIGEKVMAGGMLLVAGVLFLPLLLKSLKKRARG